MRAHSLLRCYVIDIRSRDAQPALIFRPAARARAILLDGVEVVGESGVPEVERSRGGDGVAETL